MDISDVLKGKVILVESNFKVKVELTISKIEPAGLKGGICVIFTNGTFKEFDSIFNLKFK